MPSLLYLFLIIALLVAVYFLKRLEISGGPAAPKYRYTVRPSIMSAPEREVYVLLVAAVGERYVVVPQVHLSTMLDHTGNGPNKKAVFGAFQSINGKSVDFCICDRATLAPKLAVELDDKTHLREDRGQRDDKVEGWLAAAGLPLLRIPNHGSFDAEQIKSDVVAKLTT